MRVVVDQREAAIACERHRHRALILDLLHEHEARPIAAITRCASSASPRRRASMPANSFRSKRYRKIGSRRLDVCAVRPEVVERRERHPEVVVDDVALRAACDRGTRSLRARPRLGDSSCAMRARSALGCGRALPAAMHTASAARRARERSGRARARAAAFARELRDARSRRQHQRPHEEEREAHSRKRRPAAAPQRNRTA